MLTLELDHVSRASLYEGPGVTRITRTGAVKGLNTTGLPANEILIACASVLPAYNSQYTSSGPYAACLLRHRNIEAIDAINHKVRVMLMFEATSGAPPIPPTTFVLQRGTSLVEETTEIHPGTGEVMITSWIDPADDQVGVQRVARFRYRRPHQRIVATGYFIGHPPAAMVSALGGVNLTAWRGQDPGYWLYADQSDVTRDYGNSYSITLELESKLTEDWSQYHVIGNDRGRIITPRPEVVSALRALPYAYSFRAMNGISRVGNYRMIEFNDIFGFGDIGLLDPP
jgi:hypothetical protein